MSCEAAGCSNSTTSITESNERDKGKVRLLTFDHRWTGRVDKTEMTKAGFSYTGFGDKVECEHCGLKLLNWTSTDDPLHEHATRRPLCPFINSRYRQLGQTKPPKRPKYQHIQERLDSFVAWPGRFVPKTPEELAAAGFFYIGSADRVTCFQCGITLRDWEEEHDPVTEHQRYSENCQFINKTDINQLGVATRRIEGEVKFSHTGKDNHDFESAEGACGMAAASKFDQNEVNSHSCLKANTVTFQAAADENASTLDTRASQQASETSTTTKTTKTTPLASESSSTTTTTSIGRKNFNNTTGRLVDENRRLKEKGTCKICREKGVGILFLPCGHLVTCSDCAPKVSDCVVCGNTILGTVKTFFT